MNEKRYRTRSKVWPETEAVFKCGDLLDSRSNSFETFKVNIDNIGSQGMFVKSLIGIPVNTKLKILIDFNPGGTSEILVKAEGVILRYEREGFAVRFTQIDSQELGDCILKKVVRVQLNGSNYLSLAEVQVFGKQLITDSMLYCVNSSPESNVASGKSASQSLTGWQGVPSRAVDGNTSGAWNQNLITHTNVQSKA